MVHAQFIILLIRNSINEFILKVMHFFNKPSQNKTKKKLNTVIQTIHILNVYTIWKNMYLEKLFTL